MMRHHACFPGRPERLLLSFVYLFLISPPLLALTADVENARSAGGDSGVADSYLPIAVPGGMKFDQIVTYGSHVCAMQADGTVYCWGRNYHGQIARPPSDP